MDQIDATVLSEKKHIKSAQPTLEQCILLDVYSISITYSTFLTLPVSLFEESTEPRCPRTSSYTETEIMINKTTSDGKVVVNHKKKQYRTFCETFHFLING